jgi:hypothetical protein
VSEKTVLEGTLAYYYHIPAMRTALKTLGYNETHHMQTVIENPIDADMWREAIDAKFFGEGKPYGREQWDQLLGHCQVSLCLLKILTS